MCRNGPLTKLCERQDCTAVWSKREQFRNASHTEMVSLMKHVLVHVVEMYVLNVFHFQYGPLL